ncbi:MAG: hypothetical protein VB118_06535 [Oscillospiraceae bacterium]|nr:hypothetical protein [Oscillospiraceae bacterium]
MADSVSFYNSADELKTKFKTDPAGGYLFCGTEDYLIGKWLDNFRKLIASEPMPDFNRVRLDFDDGASLRELENELSGVSFMGKYRLIEVFGLPLLKLSDRDEKSLIKMLSELSKEQIVMLIFGGQTLVPDKKTTARKIMKSLSSLIYIVDFTRLSPQRLLKWADDAFMSERVHCSDENLRLIISRCGGEMLKIENIIKVLCAYAKGPDFDVDEPSGTRHEIKREDIELFTEDSEEYEIYNLTDAVLRRDREKSFRALCSLRRKKIDPIVINASFSRSVRAVAACSAASPSQAAHITGMQEWQLRNYRDYAESNPKSFASYAAALCLETDRRLKSESIDGYSLIDTMVLRLIQKK